MATTLTNLIPELYSNLDVVSRELVGMIPAVTLDAATAAVLEVNADFFVQRLLPAFSAASERLTERLAGSSLTPDSAQPDSAAVST